MNALRPKYNKPGTSPGLRALAVKDASAHLSVFDFLSGGFKEERDISLARCADFFASPNVTWVHVQGTADVATLRSLGEAYNLHPLAVEDVANLGQRPKVESFDRQLFVTLNWPRYDQRAAPTQVSLFLGATYVVSFCAGRDDPFEPIRDRIRTEPPGRIRERGAHFLFYALIDLVIDEGFPTLDRMSSELETLEELILADPSPACLERIHHIKRSLIVLRKSLWPQREVISTLLREEHSLIDPTTLPYLRDCHDHAVQVLDLIESYREMASSLQDLYLTGISNRMNEIMKVLTIMSSIFIPMSFLAGVYGMNFNGDVSPWNMPELRARYGYPIFLFALVIVGAGMVWFFRRRKWI
ncbi:MAG: magnesium/cobalt transporter CorA [Gammaproteobacteria bacterium]